MARFLPLVITALLGLGALLIWSLLRPAPLPPLVVGVMEWPGFYPVMACAVDRIFADGPDVRVVLYPDNPSLNAALRRKEVDLITGAACDAFLLRSQGTAARIIGILDTSDGADVLLARPGVTRLGQTPDQRIACEGINSFSHLFVLDSLARAQVPEVAVHLHDISAAEVPQALLDGRLDVGHTWGPLADRAREQGCTVLVRAGDHPGVVTDVLMTRDDVIKLRHEDVRRAVQGIYDRMAAYHDRETELLSRVATFLNKPVGALSPVTGSVRLYRRDESLAALRNRSIPLGIRARLDLQVDCLRRRGQFPAEFDAEAVFDPQFLAP